MCRIVLCHGQSERGGMSLAYINRLPAIGGKQRRSAWQVRALRQAKGWTLEEAAEKGDLDLKHWQKIEAGHINVTLVTLVRIAEGLGETVGSLFGTPVAPRGRRRQVAVLPSSVGKPDDQVSCRAGRCSGRAAGGAVQQARTKQPGPGRRRSEHAGSGPRLDRAAFVDSGGPAKMEPAHPSPASACGNGVRRDARAE